MKAFLISIGERVEDVCISIELWWESWAEKIF